MFRFCNYSNISSYRHYRVSVRWRRRWRYINTRAAGTPGSACNNSGTIVTVWTDSPASGGLSVGQTVYASATSNTLYSTNTSAWWKTGAPGGNQIVNFNSSGAVASIGSC